MMRTTVMVVPCLYFSGATGLGREQRMKSSLSSTCQATHNCSGLHPPLQLREKGTTFSNSPSWPRQYVLRLLLPMGAPSHNSQHHCIGQQQLWWTPSEMVSKYLHLSKKGKSLLSLFNIILDSLEHGSRFFPRCHQEYTLTFSLAQKPNTLNFVCTRLNSFHCLNYLQVVKWGI